MKILHVKHLTLARDTRTKYEDSPEKNNQIGATGYLIAMLHKNSLTFDMFTFAPADREKAIAFANELISSGQI